MLKVCGIRVGRRCARREASALIDCDIDNNRAWTHFGDHRFVYELRSSRTRDQHRADDQVSSFDRAFNGLRR